MFLLLLSLSHEAFLQFFSRGSSASIHQRTALWAATAFQTTGACTLKMLHAVIKNVLQKGPKHTLSCTIYIIPLFVYTLLLYLLDCESCSYLSPPTTKLVRPVQLVLCVLGPWLLFCHFSRPSPRCLSIMKATQDPGPRSRLRKSSMRACRDVSWINVGKSMLVYIGDAIFTAGIAPAPSL